MPSRILLADCDAMFCAVARLEDPDGAGRAAILVVGGTRGSRGVVTSASYEARAYGIRAGLPIRTAERLCPTAEFVPVPRDAVRQKSREARAVLEEWSPVVEPASIDEFYLGMDGTEALYRREPLAETAARIRADLLTRTGLALSFGGGTNRLIAKLAVSRAKPRPGSDGTGVHVVPAGSEAEFVAGLELADIPGVGPRLAENLRKRGLVRVRDALPMSVRDLELWLGTRTGRWLFDRMRGRGSAEVRRRTGVKSVSRETTFERDLAGDDELDRVLVGLTHSVCRDLRKAGLEARTITLKLRDHDFRTRNASRTLDTPVTTDQGVLPVARELLDRLRAARRVPARLLGVGFSQLSPRGGAGQTSLFGEPTGHETGRDRRLAETMDRIQQRFGTGAIGPGRLVEPEEPEG